MKLSEIKNKRHHYFKDEQGRMQGVYKDWHLNGQQRTVSHWRDDKRHGKCKAWHENGQQSKVSHYRYGRLHGERKFWLSSGKLIIHRFFMDGNKIIDFIKNPELYPSTPEEKTMFVLKYGSAQFIGEGE